MDIIRTLSTEFSAPAERVSAVIGLIDEGNTIPFIARYRKEQTGSMDDQLLRKLSERLSYLRGLEKRRQEIAGAIEAQGKLTEELAAAIDAAATLSALEDLYRPYRPKRRTRAGMALEKGLGPLADALFAQKNTDIPEELAAPFIDPEKGVESAEAALAGARDILAERISDDAGHRSLLRRLYFATGILESRAAGEEDSVYADYYNFSQPVSKLPSHRVLAVDRGEREGFLKVSVTVENEVMLRRLSERIITGNGPCSRQVSAAAQDSLTRLIHPSLERELRSALTDRAVEGAIQVFGDNLKQLLLQPPIKGKVALGLDPGYRMGCKWAVVDATGKLLDSGVIYPVPPFKKVAEAKRTITAVIEKYKVEIIAIGNGTAGRETEQFASELLAETRLPAAYAVVSEAGASVYSASPLAAEEFPDQDVNLRSAVSIARRLQDPLAELVKIDPKAVGVGQYQHDMPPARLDGALAGVVEYCVNTVGVDLNTASPSLLSHVAGINSAVAKNIVARRETEGPFTSRAQLKKVPKLGPRAFEQCAGFLRVPGGKEPLDATAVHPESYAAAKKVLEVCGFTPADIGTEAIRTLPEAAKKQGLSRLAEAVGVGIPTLQDILEELVRPGRDMRDSLPAPLLRTGALELSDLEPGMELQGTVRNVIDFGAFVDIGVHQDGLVHISQMTRKKFIRHPSEVVKVGDVVTVWVLSVDEKKKRIGLTMKKPAQN